MRLGTLIPVINAKRQADMIPVLDFSYPAKERERPGRVKQHVHQDAPHHPDNIPITIDASFFSEHGEEKNHVGENSSEVSPCVTVDKAKEEPEKSFSDLWAQHEKEVSRLRHEDRERNGAENFFAWLDEKTQKTDFENQVFDRLKQDLENRPRYRLEFYRRKLNTVEYRTPLEQLMVTVPDQTSCAIFPEKSPAVITAMSEPRHETTKKVLLDKILGIRRSMIS